MAKNVKINKSKKQFKNYEPSKAKKLNLQKKSSAKDEKNKDVICFHYKKNGHIKSKCPLLKMNKGKYERYKKAFKAETWSDSDDDEFEQEYANICLMANLDSKSSSDEEDEVSNFKIPEAVANYIDELVSVNKTALKEISVLKKEILNLKSVTKNKEIDESIAYENECLKMENNLLKKQDISQKDKIDFFAK